MSKKKKNSNITRGRPLTQLQREMIIQAYALCGNKAAVSREIGCARETVNRVIKQAERDKDLQEARASALTSVAGQIHGKTEEIIASIGPEDMESGLIKSYNDKDDPNRLTSVKAYGPSLLQKVTSAAILTDKIKVVEETKQALLQDSGGDGPDLLLPQDIRASIRMLGDKVKALRVIDVQFKDKHEDTASKVQEVAHRAALDEDIEEADFEELDFDNPK